MVSMNFFLACNTCRNTMIEAGGDAAGWSILFLLVVVVAMLGGITFFMFRLIMRDKAALDPSLCDDFVRPEPSR
jgi:hypothetical protein